jgi:transposase
VKLHSNAKLTPKGRLELAQAVVKHGMTLDAAAAASKVSTRTANKWVQRFKTEGLAGLQDRSSRPTRLRSPTPPKTIRRIEQLRRQRMTGARIAELTGVSTATVSRVLKRLGLSRLSALDPEEPARRYEHALPGDMLHLDTKKLGRIAKPGHRVTADRTVRSRGAGWEMVFVAVDDHSPLFFMRRESRRATAEGLRFAVHPRASACRLREQAAPAFPGGPRHTARDRDRRLGGHHALERFAHVLRGDGAHSVHHLGPRAHAPKHENILHRLLDPAEWPFLHSKPAHGDLVAGSLQV